MPPQGIVKGDVDAALKASATVVSGSVTVGAQKHMYMEVQNASARFIEEDTLMVAASTQGPGFCQQVACNITGLPENKVNIMNRRTGAHCVYIIADVAGNTLMPCICSMRVCAGGGYGGKGSRQAPVVAAASLGAYVTGKQVHVQLERVQDCIMVRLPRVVILTTQAFVDVGWIGVRIVTDWRSRGLVR